MPINRGVCLPDDLAREIEVLAKKTNRSFNAVVVALLDAAIKVLKDDVVGAFEEEDRRREVAETAVVKSLAARLRMKLREIMHDAIAAMVAGRYSVRAFYRDLDEYYRLREKLLRRLMEYRRVPRGVVLECMDAAAVDPIGELNRVEAWFEAVRRGTGDGRVPDFVMKWVYDDKALELRLRSFAERGAEQPPMPESEFLPSRFGGPIKVIDRRRGKKRVE